MKAVIKFDCDGLLDPEQREALQKITIWPENDLYWHDGWREGDKEKGLKYTNESLIVNLLDIQKLKLPPFKVCKLLDVCSELEYAILKLNTLVDRLQGIDMRLGFNEKCGTGIGNEMLKIREVCVSENCCTDYLQTELLDKGWRIIAVCPQPQRRPDYILGKF